MKKFLSVALILGILCVTVPFSAAAATAADGWFYNQLDPNAKAIYRGIVNNAASNQEFVVELPSPVPLSVSGNYLSSAEQQRGWDALEPEIQLTADAIWIDRSDLFWIENYNWHDYGLINNSGSTYTWSISEVYIKINFAPQYTDIAGTAAQLQNAVSTFPVAGSVRYDKLRSIHDRLVNTITYDANDPYAHQATGGLLRGKGVCETYARSFKMICDYIGIPCVLVVSDDHMWDAVQMEDQRWYLVDATWDDAWYGLSTIYFLVGTDTVCEGVPFSQSHVATGDLSGSGHENFSYPPMSATAYQQPVRPASAFIGDINRDGSVDTVDVRLVLQFIIGKKLFPDASTFARADVNWDGEVNTVDARLMLQYIVGKVSSFQ